MPAPATPASLTDGMRSFGCAPAYRTAAFNRILPPPPHDFYCAVPVFDALTRGAFHGEPTHVIARWLGLTQESGVATTDLARIVRQRGLSVVERTGATIDHIRHAIANGYEAAVSYLHPADNHGHLAIVERITNTHITLLEADAPRGRTLRLSEFSPRWRCEYERGADGAVLERRLVATRPH